MVVAVLLQVSYIILGLFGAFVAVCIVTVIFGKQPNPDPIKDDDDLWVW